MRAGPAGTQAVLQVQKQSQNSAEVYTVFLQRQDAAGVQAPARYEYNPEAMQRDNEALKETLLQYPQGLQTQVCALVTISCIRCQPPAPGYRGPPLGLRLHAYALRVKSRLPGGNANANLTTHHNFRECWSARLWKHKTCLLSICLVWRRTFMSRFFFLSLPRSASCKQVSWTQSMGAFVCLLYLIRWLLFAGNLARSKETIQH